MTEFQQILDVVRACTAPSQPVYLVGGAVRDALMGRSPHDLDFVTPASTLPVARAVANALRAGLYVMDAERDITRVVLRNGSEGERIFLDFSGLREADLESDLRARDFTINAMAFDVAAPERLIDPCGGVQDLRARLIRACSADSLSADPVRVLRGVRQAVGFRYRIDPQTKAWMQSAGRLLPSVSSERIRDELFRLLEGEQVALGLRLLDHFGVLPFVLPELEELKGVTQSAPHVLDVWNHTLSLLQHLEALLDPLVGAYREDTVRDLTVGSAVLWLGRFRESFAAHFAQQLAPGRALRGLLFLAALYHDIQKPATRSEQPSGKVQFLAHEARGAKVAAARARALVLSVAEIERLETIVAAHMRVHGLAMLVRSGEQISRRAIYRFFQAAGAAGVDVCLLSLADTRATYGAALPADAWEAELVVCRTLLEAYWERPAEVVSPPRLVSGTDLMEQLSLPAGPMIGTILANIREAQAAGEVSSRDEALDCARAVYARALGEKDEE